MKLQSKTIQSKENEKKSKEEKITALTKEQGINSGGQIDLIKNEIALKIKPLNDELEIISEKINDLETRQKGFTLDAKEKDEKLRQLKDRKLELISNSEGTGIDDLAPDNQVFRVATWLKGWFVIDYNKEIKKIDDQIFELERQKVQSITEEGRLTSCYLISIKIVNQIMRQLICKYQGLKKKLDFERKAERALNTVESVYADLPRGAITAAFLLWFELKFIISVTGTMLALQVQSLDLNFILLEIREQLIGKVYQ